MIFAEALGIKVSMQQAHSLEPCDYDLDGDLDLFVSREISDTIVTGEGTEIISHMQVTLLQNNIGNKNNWTAVQVVQPDGVNKAGIGSRIYIKSDSITQIREIQAGLGHFAGQQQLIRFAGLGDVNRIDDISVRLPNADLENVIVKNPPMNVIIIIDENGYAGYLKTWEEDKPIIQIKEPFLAFDTLHAGESKELLFHIQNIGEEVLEIKEINMPDQDIADYFSLVDVEFPINIEPNNEYEFALKFQPDKRQHFDGDLRVISNAHNAPDKGLDIYAYSHQDEPLIAVDKSTVEFQPIWIDSVDTQTMDIINKGELPLVINSIEFEDAEIFSCVANLPIEIEAGSHIKLDVSFQPDSVTNYESRMTIGSNGYYYPQFDVELKGICNGPAPIITVNTTNLFFGTVYVNETKDRSFKLTNSGNSEMLISDFIFAEYDDIYEVIDTELPIELEVEESKNVYVRFSPSYDGDFSTTMHLGSNAYNNDEISFNITGKGKESTSVHDERYAENDELHVKVSPVPFESELAISYYIKNATSGNISFDLYNSTGQIVDSIYSGFANAGENNIVHDLSGISDGVYYLIVKYNSEVLTIPIVRLR
jgi:hypothetical protein